MTIAVNDAGDVLTLSSGKWQPATRAQNDAGDTLVLDGGAWKPIATTKQTDDYSGTGAEGMSPDQPSPIASGLGRALSFVGKNFEDQADVREGIAGRIGGAAAKGFNDATPAPTKEGEDTLNAAGPVVRQIIAPAAHLAGGALGGSMAALSQAAMEVFGEKGGRDALALLATLPMVKGEAMNGNPVAAPAPETVPTPPRFVSETTAPDVSQLDPRNAIQTLITHDIMENGTPPPDRGAPNQSLIPASVLQAPDLDSAISAADKASQTPYTPVTVSQVAARDGVDVNEAYRRMVAENAAQRAPEPPPTPATLVHVDEAGNALEPQSVGAAASREQTPESQIALSPADMKANRYQAEMGELLAPPSPNDKAVYVKGSLPTLAEYSGDPLISQQENLVRQRNPNAFVGEGKRLTENNNARVAAYDDQTPSRTALDMMRDNRNAQWISDSEKILPNAQPADLTPAWEWVSQQLDNPRIQENDSVRSTLEGFRDRLINDGGELKTDPAAVWGIHDNLQNQLAKAKDPLNATSAEKYSFSELMAAKRLIDSVMNESTGNQFQTALDNYAKASQDINAGEALESFRPKLTNSSGAIMGERYHNFVVGLAKLRGEPGIDPAMSISDDTMRALINIDNDMKRAGLIKLGAAAGSPTNLLGALAESMGVGAAHLAVGSMAPGMGNMALHAVGKAGLGALGKYRLDKLTEKHLAPPEGGYVYPRDAGP